MPFIVKNKDFSINELKNDAIIISIPWDNGSTIGGQRFAVKIWDDIISNYGLESLYYGEIITIPYSVDATFWIIKCVINEIFQKRKKTIILGGDHSITFPVVNGIYSFYGKPIDIFVFDAHFDYLETFNVSLAENFLFLLKMNGYLRNIYWINDKSYYEHSAYYMDKPGKLNKVELDKILSDQNGYPYYCSIDIDIFSDFNQIVSYPDGKIQVHKFLNDIINHSTYKALFNSAVSIDLVELNPIKKRVIKTNSFKVSKKDKNLLRRLLEKVIKILKPFTNENEIDEKHSTTYRKIYDLRELDLSIIIGDDKTIKIHRKNN